MSHLPLEFQSNNPKAITMDKLSRHIYELRLRNKFLELRGKAFQDFFCDIMEKKYKGNFMRCKPWGRKGDQKNDGYLKSKRTLFQIYAPDEMTETAFKRKLKRDFNGAIAHWKEFFDTWVFVHNARDGVGPEQLKEILTLDGQAPKIQVQTWNYENLKALFFSLKEEDMSSLLGPILFSKSDSTDKGTKAFAPPSTFKAEIHDWGQEKKRKLTEREKKAEHFFNAAERHYEKRDYKSVILNYQESIKAIPTMSAYLNKGNCLLDACQYSAAKRAFDAGLKIARFKKNAEFKGAFLGSIGLVLMEQGKLDEALKSYQNALKIHQRIKNPLGRANQLGNIGIVLMEQGKLDEALKSYHEALDIFRQIKNSLGQAQALSNIGIVLRQQGKLDDALKSLKEALEIHRRIKNPLGQAQALGNIGNVLMQQGKLDDALKSLKEALEIHRRIKIPLGQAQALGNIGLVLMYQGKQDEALEHYQQSLKLHTEIKNPLGQASALGNIGLVLMDQGKLDEALKSYQDALEIFRQIKNPLGQANQLGNIGIFLSQQGKKKQALEHLQQSREIYLKFGFQGEGLAIVEQAIIELSQNLE